VSTTPAGVSRAQRQSRADPREGRPRRRLLPIIAATAALAPALLLALAGPALAHGDGVPAPTFPGVLLDWSLDPLPLIGCVLAAALYLWAEHRIAIVHPANRVPRHRRWLFLGGLLVIILALSSPIDTYEDTLFSVHMVQHMLLELVAAPLLVLAAPITLALRAASSRWRRVILAVLHSHVVRWIAFPLTAWLLFAAVNWGWHFSSLYEVALENDLVHYGEHISMLAAGLLFWWPAISPDPMPWRMPHPVRILYLFLAMPQVSFLGVALLSADSVLYPHYQEVAPSWGSTPLADQQLGGVLMWVMGDMVFLVAMIAVVAAWMRFEDIRTARLDARLDEEERIRAAAEAEERSPGF
jgi:putative membrane protein